VPVVARSAAMASAVAATLTGFWLSGLFVLQGAGSLASGGLGYYSMNLLAPISPLGWSAVLPELPIASDGQAYEGFQYLGLGNLLLIAGAVLLARRTRRDGRATRDEPIATRLWTPAMVAMCLLMAAFAVSPTITAGRWVLADLNGAWSAPLATFRSSGRFFWPLAYLGLAWAIVTVATRLSRPVAIAAMSVAVVVQAVDLRAILEDRRRTARSDAFYTWANPFTSPRWAALVPGYAHLVLVPPPQCGPSPQPYEAAMRLASQHGLTLNAGVIARGDVGAQRRYCADLDARIDAARIDADTLYVLSEAGAAVMAKAADGRVVCGPVDTVWLCTVAEAHVRWRDAAPFDRVPGR